MSFSRKACFSRDFPVGLIRSPMSTGFPPNSTAWMPEATAVRSHRGTGGQGRGEHFSTTWAR